MLLLRSNKQIMSLSMLSIVLIFFRFRFRYLLYYLVCACCRTDVSFPDFGLSLLFATAPLTLTRTAVSFLSIPILVHDHSHHSQPPSRSRITSKDCSRGFNCFPFFSHTTMSLHIPRSTSCTTSTCGCHSLSLTNPHLGQFSVCKICCLSC